MKKKQNYRLFFHVNHTLDHQCLFDRVSCCIFVLAFQSYFQCGLKELIKLVLNRFKSMVCVVAVSKGTRHSLRRHRARVKVRKTAEGTEKGKRPRTATGEQIH